MDKEYKKYPVSAISWACSKPDLATCWMICRCTGGETDRDCSCRRFADRSAFRRPVSSIRGVGAFRLLIGRRRQRCGEIAAAVRRAELAMLTWRRWWRTAVLWFGASATLVHVVRFTLM